MVPPVTTLSITKLFAGKARRPNHRLRILNTFVLTAGRSSTHRFS